VTVARRAAARTRAGGGLLVTVPPRGSFLVVVSDNYADPPPSIAAVRLLILSNKITYDSNSIVDPGRCRLGVSAAARGPHHTLLSDRRTVPPPSLPQACDVSMPLCIGVMSHEERPR
jgi:hypothetical protein